MSQVHGGKFTLDRRSEADGGGWTLGWTLRGQASVSMTVVADHEVGDLARLFALASPVLTEPVPRFPSRDSLPGEVWRGFDSQNDVVAVTLDGDVRTAWWWDLGAANGGEWTIWASNEGTSVYADIMQRYEVSLARSVVSDEVAAEVIGILAHWVMGINKQQGSERSPPTIDRRCPKCRAAVRLQVVTAASDIDTSTWKCPTCHQVSAGADLLPLVAADETRVGVVRLVPAAEQTVVEAYSK